MNEFDIDPGDAIVLYIAEPRADLGGRFRIEYGGDDQQWAVIAEPPLRIGAEGVSVLASGFASKELAQAFADSMNKRGDSA